MPEPIDLESTIRRISARLANKSNQKYGLFSKLSSSVIGSGEVAKNSHLFPTRGNQYIQENNRNFDGTLNNFGTMLFSANQEQNESYTLRTCCCNHTSHILF